ncbi:MAG: hypothetical protein JWN67_170 [Actinomycetia bacterium]|nr:hypothetical protein [Actinomycetes bacterium]
MAVRVVPTLAAMAEVYRRSAVGGQDSPRFHTYTDLGREGMPVAGWNPMTSKDVLGTVERLLAIGAETIVSDVAAEVSDRLGADEDIAVAIVVAAPGMWTDRLATEVEHRLAGRGRNELLFWQGEDVGVEAVRSIATADVVRALWAIRYGIPASVKDAVAQEGLALSLAGMGGRFDDEAAKVFDVLADDTSLSSMVAFLYGDEAATGMGYTPVGLGPRVGERHAVALVERLTG